MKVGDLFVRLGVAADNVTAKEFGKTISEIPLSAAAAVASLAGLSYGFVEMTKNVLDMTSGFKVFTAETGENTLALQQWQQVAKEAGISSNVVTGALTTLSAMMGQMETGTMNPATMLALGKLGVSESFLGKDPYQMMNEIQGLTKGMKARDATALLNQVFGGGGGELMRMFQTPQSARERISPIMSGGDINAMAELQKELAQFNKVALHEFVKALVEVEPYMGDLTKAMSLFIQTFGETLRYWLEKFHGMGKSTMGQDIFKAMSLDDITVGRTLVYYGGDATYNINGLSDAERAARTINDDRMKAETMAASAHFNRSGN